MGRMVRTIMASEPVLYEAMYILNSELSEEEIAAVEERLKAGLEAQGAQVQSVHEFARRRLAYPIKGHTQGIFRVMYFRGNGAAVDELKHEFLLSEEIIRGMVVVANPKYMVGDKAPTGERTPETAESADEETAPELEAEAPAQEPVTEPETEPADQEPEASPG